MLPLVDRAGIWYWAGMCLSGAFLFYHVGKLTASGSKVLASRVLHASVLYLPVVLGIMVFWKA
jgi:hypothetical protein